MLITKLKRKQIDKYSLFLFAIIVIIRTIFTSRLDTPVGVTGADEIGTIASAAYFAGYDWSGVISNIIYYGFGYSMLLAPIFMLFKNPVTIYHMLLFSNNIVIALCAVLAYRILISFLKLEDKRVAMGIAAMTVLYFPVGCNGNGLINECALQLIVWVVLYLLLYLNGCEKGRKRNIGTVALVVVIFYSLLVHSRSVVLIAVTVITIFVTYIITKKNIVNAYIFYPFIVVGWVGSKFLVNMVQSGLWLADGKEPLDNSSEQLFSVFFDNLKLLCSYNGIKGYLSELIGQIYSMTVLTYGIFIIACVTIVIFLKRFWKEKLCKDNCSVNVGITILFGVMGVVATLLSSSLVALEVVVEHIVNNAVSKWYLYNRYWSIYMTVVIMLGGYLLYRYRKCALKIMLVSLNLILFIALVFNGYLGYRWGGTHLGMTQTGVYYPYIAIGFLNTSVGMTDTTFFKITIIVLIVFAAFAFIVFKEKMSWAYLLLCTVMFANYAYETCVVSINTSDKLSVQFNEMREIVEDAEYVSDIYCDGFSKFTLWLQYNFPRHKVICDVKDIKDENAIVFTENLMGEFAFGDWSVIYHGDDEVLQQSDVYMLVRGDALKKTLSDKGYDLQEIDWHDYTMLDYNVADENFETTGFWPIEEDAYEWTITEKPEIICVLEKDDYHVTIEQGAPIPMKSLGLTEYIIEVFVNGEYVDKLVVNSDNNGETLEFDVPEEYIYEGKNVISFESILWSPADYGSEDTRNLGFCLESMKFRVEK